MYSPLVSAYDELFPLTNARKKFLKAFCTKESLQVLDIGCATGKDAYFFASHGAHVRAFDNNLDMIKFALNYKRDENIMYEVRSMEDMFELKGTTYDVILCLGNTVTHLSKEERRHFFKEVNELLSFDGTLIMSYLNYDYIMSEHITMLDTYTSDRYEIIREYKNVTPVHLTFQTTLIRISDGTKIIGDVSLYPLFEKEVASYIKEYKLQITEEYEDFSYRPYDVNTSLQHIVCFQRMME